MKVTELKKMPPKKALALIMKAAALKAYAKKKLAEKKTLNEIPNEAYDLDGEKPEWVKMLESYDPNQHQRHDEHSTSSSGKKV